MPRVVLLNHQITRDHIASIHKEGCRDIERDQTHHAALIYGPYDNVEAALTEYIDSEMVEMGWTREDVKIYHCVKG